LEATDNDKHWNVVLTRTNSERKVRDYFQLQEVDTFLPVQNRVIEREGKRIERERLLLPRMVFVHISRQEMFAVRNTLNVYELALFLPREDGLYEKCEEEHVQKAYSIEAIKAMIVKAGMELVAVCDAYTHNPGDENCERLTFVAREHGKSAQNGYHGRIPEKPETHRAD